MGFTIGNGDNMYPAMLNCSGGTTPSFGLDVNCTSYQGKQYYTLGLEGGAETFLDDGEVRLTYSGSAELGKKLGVGAKAGLKYNYDSISTTRWGVTGNIGYNFSSYDGKKTDNRFTITAGPTVALNCDGDNSNPAEITLYGGVQEILSNTGNQTTSPIFGAETNIRTNTGTINAGVSWSDDGTGQLRPNITVGMSFEIFKK